MNFKKSYRNLKTVTICMHFILVEFSLYTNGAIKKKIEFFPSKFVRLVGSAEMWWHKLTYAFADTLCDWFIRWECHLRFCTRLFLPRSPKNDADISCFRSCFIAINCFKRLSMWNSYENYIAIGYAFCFMLEICIWNRITTVLCLHINLCVPTCTPRSISRESLK